MRLGAAVLGCVAALARRARVSRDLSARQGPARPDRLRHDHVGRHQARALHVRGRLGRAQLPAQAGHHPRQVATTRSSQVIGLLAGHVGQPALHRGQAGLRVLVRLPLQQGRARWLHADRVHEEGRPRHLPPRRTVSDAPARRPQDRPAGRPRRWPTGGGSTPTVDPQAALDALGPARKSWLLSAPLPPPVPQPGDDRRSDDDRRRCRSSVAGFSAPAFGAAREDVRRLERRAGARRRRGAASPTEGGPTKFVMGGAIAVELIRGDMSRRGDRHRVVRRRRQGARVRPPDVPDRRDLRAGRRPRTSTRSSRRRRARS